MAALHAGIEPRVMHVDIDAFFASVEQRLDPRLRGRPVVVGSGVIASCSYEARRHGLRAGMPLAQARRLCPEAVVLAGRCATYRCFASRVFDLCREVAPGVEAHLDEAYCDMAGTERLYGHPANAAAALKRRILRETGLTVSVGIASNRMVAKVAGGAVKPDGLAVVERGGEEAFIRGLPVGKLPGVGHATEAVLRRLNVRTVAEMQMLSADSLRQMFGANGLLLYERCRGRDTRVVEEREIPRTISRETTFHAETCDPREVLAMIHYLTERAANAMRSLGLKARGVTLRLRDGDGAGRNGSSTLPLPADLDGDLFQAASALLGRLWTRRVSLRWVGVTLSRFSADVGHQAELFDEKALVRRESLCRCLDTLRSRFGHSAVVAGKSLDLLGKLEQDRYGYVLRTPCLTK